jgi:crotonobetainyl-CoA:carnitine CoA-transferase CaiB-like acyl-CoA transferase
MVMGPTCGLVLADMGADVIKIEPIEGDRTRQLMGAGTGFFPMFNRNKRNLLLDLKQAEGVAIAKQLCLTADIVAENFKSGVMAKYGLDYAQLSAQNQRLIYITLKGFLPGPYAHRTALDEVVQMMGGLAYMTGRPGDPLRAGTSVNDIMGGMFGAIGALGALIERGISGKGQEVQSALFENNIFLVGQHMMQYAMTGQAPSPMPSRISPWAIYDVFTVKNNEQIFLAAVSDGQWQTLCTLMQWADLLANSAYLSNNDRVAARPILLEEIRNRLKPFLATELAQLFESAGLPFAPINRPEDLLDDPHLNQTGGLMPVVLSDGPRAGETVKTTLLPFTLDGQRLGVRLNPPRMGEHSNAILTELGFSQTDIDGLLKRGVVA